MTTGERIPVAPSAAPPAPRRPPQPRVRTVVRTRQERDSSDIPELVPRVLRVSAALGWRLLVVVAALYVIAYAVSYVAAVVVPVAAVGAAAAAGEGLESSGPSGLASGSTRRAPSNAPSARNSSRPCGATEVAADSAGGAEQGLLQAIRLGLHSPMILTSTRFGRRPSNSP